MNVLELAASFAALAAAMLFNHAADGYIERVGETAPVSPDLFLRHLPALDVSAVYWWGAAAFAVFAAAVALTRERERLAYFARAYALLIVARACLMTLTPLHIPAGAVSVDDGVLYGSVGRMVTVHHDLFFSMHTAAPFLASLLFRDRWARRICLGFSFLLGATVLLLKTHYSLDVAGAFLVTYALYTFERRRLEPLVRRAARAGVRPKSIAPALILLVAGLSAPARSGEKAPAAAAGIEWVDIPGGAFTMGTDDPAGPFWNARPPHRVTVKSFQMAKTLVTNKQYRACVAAGACSPAVSYGPQNDGDDQPVVGLNWDQAKVFSRWAGGRLPTEAEWEYAARGAGRDQKYPWGDEEATCARAVLKKCAEATAPVCSKPAGNTAQGLCDMAGNAWEWIEDQYHHSYKGAPDDGSAWGDEDASSRVIRGGYWRPGPADGRAAFRNHFDRHYHFGILSFRPVR